MKIIALVAFVLFILNYGLNAQTVADPEDVSINVELKTPKDIPDNVLDTLIDPMSILTSSDTVNISLFLNSQDTSNISKIHVKLGTSDGGSELIQTAFDFDVISQPNGLFYERINNLIKVGLGEYKFRNVFYVDIWLEDINGNLSQVVKSQSN